MRQALRKVISGGQTGADQAGWRAARRFGLQTGGAMPLGFLTEDGPRPDFADDFGAVQHPSPQYPPRTRVNATAADATIWFGSGDSRGRACTLKHAGRFLAEIAFEEQWDPGHVAGLIASNGVAILNVAGNRESSSPGIGEWVERYLCEVFVQMRIWGLIEKGQGLG
jgi:hypothetical protein